jgi:hypothetical protein
MTAVRKELRRRRKPLWFATAFVALAAVLVFAFGASANLPGSTFEGNDGNFVVNTAGNTDWVNVHGGVTPGVDLPTGQNDNSFGQGTKESDVNVTVVNGGIPNSKADLGNFYLANETLANNHVLMYLGWTRVNTSGTTNFDFEINKLEQPDLTTPGPKTLLRSAGDIIINYDFQGGAQNPTLSFRTWQANGTWSAATPITSPSGESEVNRVDVANPLAQPPSPATAPAFTFGEAAIDLTALNIVPVGACAPFSSAYVKSRSSDSFTSAVKDFIAPVHLNLSRCGTVTIIKHTDPGGLNQDFGYTSNLAGGSEFSCTADSTPASFTLNDAGTDTEVCSNVPIGNYTVLEGADPANFVFGSLSCTATGSGTGAQDGTVPKQANIGIVAGGDTVTCTYINNQQLGAIKITKQRKHAADGPGLHPHGGVTFTVTGGGLPAGGTTVVTDATTGVACLDGLVFATDYVVTETVPSGYHSDDSVKEASVSESSDCGDGNEAEVGFVNTPLTNITASVDSQVNGGTASTITCVDSDGNTVASGTTGANGDGSATGSNLEPDTYTCTLVVDP